MDKTVKPRQLKTGPLPRFTIEELIVAVKVHGSINKASKALGMAYSSVRERLAPHYGRPEFDALSKALDASFSLSLSNFLADSDSTLRRMMKKLESRPEKWMLGWGIAATNRARLSGGVISGTVNVDHKITIEEKRSRFLRFEALEPLPEPNANN